MRKSLAMLTIVGAALLTCAWTFAGPPDAAMYNARDDLRAAIVGVVPGVEGTGFGIDKKGNRDIVVYVASLTPSTKAKIPASYEGFPVVIKVAVLMRFGMAGFDDSGD